MPLVIQHAQYSSAGIKPVNEDACGIQVPEEPLLTTKGIAAVLADGMSASEAGREASEACVRGFISDYYSTPESWTARTSVHKILSALNRWLFGQGIRVHNTHKGMVTTISIIILKSSSAHIFHVGDTRIYRLRDGALELLTNDHRVEVADNKSYLTRALGIDLSLEVDYRREITEVGDLFLCVTDGIYDFLGDEQIRQTLREHADDLDTACRELAERALANGSDDNLSCQLLAITELPGESQNEFYQKLTELPFPPPLDAGMVLDGFRIVRPLFANKRTEIYLAHDTINDREVVIKAPSVNYADDPDYINQFLHEEWAGRRINNPHVLRTLDIDRKRQFIYYVTEHIEGQTLRQWQQDHPQPQLHTVRDFAEQIANGLRAFHRLEMIHLDLKPENVVIDRDGTLKIIDFGSTRIAGIEEIETPFDTDNVPGTVNYTAPELILGQPPSNRSDIYSLGVIIYELLTGKLPYHKPVTLRNYRQLRYVSARERNEAVPVWMDRALEKAVKIDPNLRYGLLSEFIHDLKQPNPAFLRKDFVPLAQRDPLRFWKGFSLLMAILNLLLVVALLR